MRFLSFWILLSMAAAGCSGETAILVEVRSDEVFIPSDIDAIRIRAVGQVSGRVTDRLFTPDVLPASLAILPGAGSDSEPVRVTVWGRKDGVDRIKRGIETAFVTGETVDATVTLERDCLNVTCEGETNYCLRGACVQMVMPNPDMGVADMDPPRDDMNPSDMDPPSDDMNLPVDMNGPADLGLDAGLDMGPPDMFVPSYDGLIISEYVEPSSGNLKAIEVFNGTGGPLSLAACQLELFRNGAATGSAVATSDAVLAAGETFVFCHGELASAMPALCDSDEGTSLNHNGDDAFAIRCDGAIVDSLGANTGDPGDGWTGGGLSTQDRTLRRACPPIPDTNLGDAFDPSANWVGLPANTFDGLGARSCPSAP